MAAKGYLTLAQHDSDGFQNSHSFEFFLASQFIARAYGFFPLW